MIMSRKLILLRYDKICLFLKIVCVCRGGGDMVLSQNKENKRMTFDNCSSRKPHEGILKLEYLSNGLSDFQNSKWFSKDKLWTFAISAKGLILFFLVNKFALKCLLLVSTKFKASIVDNFKIIFKNI